MPLYAQVVLGLSPLQAGLLMLPLSVALTLTSQFIGGLPKYISARVVATVGLLATTTGVLGLSCRGPGSSLAAVAGWLTLIGVGGGLFHPPNNTSVLAAVPHGMLGSANGLFTTARNFGQALGVSLAAAMLGAGLARTGAGDLLTQNDPVRLGAGLAEFYTQAQGAAFHLAAVFGLGGALLSALRGPPIMAPPPEELGK